MTSEEKDELAALHAAGALDGSGLASFLDLLDSGDEEAVRALAGYQEAAAHLAAGTATSAPPAPLLKQQVLRAVQRRAAVTGRGRSPGPALAAFKFLAGADATGWQQALLPGASIKVLVCNRQANYAVVLGKLEAGVRYPAHDHVGPEELYVLSGDLHVGEHVLHAGDFHHAEAGTHHGVNYSVEGCTLLAVVHPSVLDELGVNE